MKKFLKRLLDAMAKAKSDEERKALYDLIEQIRDEQDANVDDAFWRDLEGKLDGATAKMSNPVVTRTGSRRAPSYRYKANHKRATKPADDCHQTITDAEKAEEIERVCPSCANKAKFKYDEEVKTNQ